MVNLSFNVLGINNVVLEPTDRFTCVTSDGNSIYLGSESTTSIGHVWKYANGVWTQITNNLANENLKAITSLVIKKGVLYASTGGNFEAYGAGQVWKNSDGVWVNTNLLTESQSYLRKLVKIKDNLYTAGSVLYLSEFKNNAWNKIYTWANAAPYDVAFFTDLETDGTNLYACGTQLGKNTVNIKKFDGTTFTDYTLNANLYDSNNEVIIKLCYYNNKLHAATYNESTGTQIHEIAEDGTSTKINIDGFGNAGNYSISCMKVIDGNLVVSTENNEGAEIWAYNPSDGWAKQSISSSVRYSSFLIESTTTGNFVIGIEVVRLLADSETSNYINYLGKLEKKVHLWPEGSIGAIPIGIDKYRFFASNNRHTLISEGPLLDPLNYVGLNSLKSNYNIDSALPYPTARATRLDTSAITFSGEELILPGAFTERFNFNPSETFASAHFPGMEIIYPIEYQFLLEAVPLLRLIGATKFFNALHTAIIPKGVHRGKVFMMNSQVILMKSSRFSPSSVPWSCQNWVIMDPSPDAGTAEKPRFLNYFLPICSGEYVTVSAVSSNFDTEESVTVTRSSYDAPNLFCAGHAWDHEGNLIMAGGTRWAFDHPSFSSVFLNGIGGFYHGDRRTYTWNPASVTASWKSGSLSGGPQNDLIVYSPEQHYASAGSWTRGPDLKEDRWYPTVMIHPRIPRTNNYPHAMIFGGSDEYSFAAKGRVITPQYDNYESLVLSGGVNVSNCGFYNDFSGLQYVFKGPAPDPTNVYIASGTFKPKDATGFVTSATLESKVPRGGFYFYPRTYLLSGGGVTFAGMTDESALLANHSTQPGVWQHTLGGTRSGQTVAYNEYFAQYNSSVRLPNVSGNTDRILRLGGENVFMGVTWSLESGIDGTANTVSLLDCSVSTNQWSPVLNMFDRRSNFNTVLLPDATLFVVGGFETLLRDLSPLPTFAFNINGDPDVTVEEMVMFSNPAVFYDHHGGEGHLNFGDFNIDQDHFEHMVEHFEEFYSINPPQESGDGLNLPAGGIQFHAFPEVISSGLDSTTRYEHAPHISWRDYHSACILLPDGRLLLSGGENRHSLVNGRVQQSPNQEGYDFEIFSPAYLRPTQNSVDTLPRPTNIGLSGATYNSAQDVNCYELGYGNQYILSSDFIAANTSIQKVVFMAPGAVTHHADVVQRYYACDTSAISNTQIRFELPSNMFKLPPGFYMVFAVTNYAVPSVAMWVKVLMPPPP
jgi:hypothetical protein